MRKKLFFAAAVVSALVVAGVYFLGSHLNGIVASVIEKEGSKVTETTVSVSGVRISIRDGRGSISGLRVASPKGFDAGNVFALGDITVDLDEGSLGKNPIVIDEVRIRKPEVNAQVLKDGKSNVEELNKRIQDYSGSGSSSGSMGDKRIRIRKFVVEEGSISVDAAALGVDKHTVKLPAIQLDDVGGANGAPPDQIGKLIAGALARKTASTVAGSEVNRLIQDKLGNSLPDKAKGLIDKIIH
jgi:hypothetical protein